MQTSAIVWACVHVCMWVFVWSVSVFMCYSPRGWLRDYLLIIHVTASGSTAQAWKRFPFASFTHKCFAFANNQRWIANTEAHEVHTCLHMNRT